jgi:6-phosphofructo-2-kinase
VGWAPSDAVKDYIARIEAKIPKYETLAEPDFTYIKLINVNERMEVRNATGYLASRIVFYLMNLHTQYRTIYFVCAGQTLTPTFKSDDDLSPKGEEYAKRMTDRLLQFRAEEKTIDVEQGEKPRKLIVPPSHPPT